MAISTASKPAFLFPPLVMGAILGMATTLAAQDNAGNVNPLSADGSGEVDFGGGRGPEGAGGGSGYGLGYGGAASAGGGRFDLDPSGDAELTVTFNILEVVKGTPHESKTIRGVRRLFLYEVGSCSEPVPVARSSMGIGGGGMLGGGMDDAYYGEEDEGGMDGMGGGYGGGMGGGMSGMGGGMGAYGGMEGDDYGDGMDGGYGDEGGYGGVGLGGGMGGPGAYGGQGNEQLLIEAFISNEDTETKLWKRPIQLAVRLGRKSFHVPLTDMQFAEQLNKETKAFHPSIEKNVPAAEIALISGMIEQSLRMSAMNKALQDLKQTSVQDVAELEGDLRGLLIAQYDTQIQKQELQIARIEKRVEALKSQVVQRKSAKKRVVEVKLGTLILQAQGLLDSVDTAY